MYKYKSKSHVYIGKFYTPYIQNVIILDGQIRVTNSKSHDIKIDRTGFIASSKKFTRWNVQLTPDHPG